MPHASFCIVSVMTRISCLSSLRFIGFARFVSVAFALMLALGSLSLPLAAFAQTQTQPRSRVLFNDGWLFQKGDPAGAGDTLRYDNVRDLIIPAGDNLLNYLPPARAAASQAAASKKYSADFSAIPYLRPGFNDSGWRKLALPHDWGIEGPFAKELPGNTGKLPWAGVGWYRKHFNLPPVPANATANARRTYLEIDGAQSHALVFLNGHLVGGWPFGYASWRVDLSPWLKTGPGVENENVLAIRLENPAKSSRWYPGSGIYRNVWLVQTAPVAVAQWGVFVTTPSVTKERALVNIAVTLDTHAVNVARAARAAQNAGKVEASVRLFAADENGRPAGAPVATGPLNSANPNKNKNENDRAPRGAQASYSATLAVASPRLWSLAQRNRYVAEVTVTQNGAVVDRVLTPFGIRTLEFTPDRGFLLNGERVPIRGVCQHHDLGALGAAINTRALERQIEILQSFGCNAIRTSHNPPAPELLDLCDRMGMLVMDEAFDCWAQGKNPDDYRRLFADWHEKDLRALIRRDRNHPSVILWSFGNEIRELWEPDGWKLAAHLAAIVREEDRTRPATVACDNRDSGYNGTQNVVDAFGFNYKPYQYAIFHATHPHIPVYGSETQSAISSRGEYFFPVTRNTRDSRVNFQVSSYDPVAVPWGQDPDVEWAAQDANPFVLGEFVWTGFDYLGEPTPYNEDSTNLLNFSDPVEKQRMADEMARLGKLRVPSRSSYFGIVDLAGFPKDRYYLFQAHWRPDLPMAHILPHWNWPERIGQITPVYVYATGDEVELYLNGKSLGRQKRGTGEARYRFRWNDVKYEPGELKAIAYKNGKPWAETVMRTAGEPAQIQLAADRAALHADGADLSFITVTIADKNGTMAPRANNLVKFSIEGPAEIAAVDNGDATSFESFQAPRRKAYNGLALVIVRTKSGEKGVIKLTAQSDGLAPAQIALRSE